LFGKVEIREVGEQHLSFEHYLSRVPALIDGNACLPSLSKGNNKHNWKEYMKVIWEFHTHS
jgi:hypothetical protein